MNYSDYRFTLDVQIHQAQVSVPVTLNDTARRLYIGFTDGRKPYTIPDGCRAVFAALKPDGNTILNDCIIENNKTVVYEFSKNTTNAEGIVDCEIRLYDKDGKELTSPQFIIVVDKKAVRDEEIPLSESESTTLDDIIRSEFKRIEAEEERKKLAQFLATSGGVIVAEDEPQEELGNVWINSSDEEEEVFLLDSTDIAHELSDEDDKIPNLALLKDALDNIGTGSSGKDGEDGKTPYIQDGYWYIDGVNTNVKAEGKDGKDGTNGVDGKDGKKGEQGEQGANGTGLYRGTVVSDEDAASSDETDIVETIDKPNGEPFIVGDMVLDKNGVIWRIFDNKGHVTLVTSTKGEKGTDGYTPIKGVDYYTEADKSEFSEYIASELAKRGQLKPEFANDISECTDNTKLYVLPDGYIYAYMFKEGSGTKANFTNQIPISTDTDGSIYDGDGYADNSYLSSSGGISTKSGCVVSGFIPYTADKPLYFEGVDLSSASTYTRVNLYDSSKTKVGNMTQTGKADSNVHLNYNFDIVAEGDYFKMTPKNLAASFSGVAFIRISCEFGITGDEWIVTVDEPITYTTSESGYSWQNTGHAFIPANYENRIIELEERLTQLENGDVPPYWVEELNTKSDAIRLAMENAGRNKSSFLWYTDSHWTYGNSKVSPLLLKYLWKNTPINKVNFGGDIVVNAQDRDKMQYVYNEWRKAIRELPNHHSVVGNHDLMVDYPYTFLIAPEESADMVMGDGMHYYIDNLCEKTRYLYLDYLTSSETEAMTAQGTFILDALVSAPNGWHIVVISHRWLQYTSSDTPTVGSIPNYYSDILRLFDAYNSRLNYSGTTYFSAQNFANCGGKVEFCIGGHIHVDHDLTSSGGIPIIITASDTNQERSGDEQEDCGTVGTITESAVYGIIADYDNSKITVIGVGRGGSREITY